MFKKKSTFTSAQVVKASFVWSEFRLLIAAVALFIGGFPPIFLIFPTEGIIVTFLKLSWIVSGAASIYLLYAWNKNGKKLFGKKDRQDLIAFWIMTISGLNLGITGLFNVNIGFSITSSKIVFFIVGLLYLWAAIHLKLRWRKDKKKLF